MNDIYKNVIFITIIAIYIGFTKCTDITICSAIYFNFCKIISLNNECVEIDRHFWIKSVNTTGTCVRLYKENHCTGKSVAIYPGSISHHDLKKVNISYHIGAIGNCFDHDKYFECTDKSSRSKRQANQYCELAKDVLTIGFLPWRTRDTTRLDGSPVRYYQIHPRNSRTESMEALITRNHLNTGSSTNQAARNYAHQMGRNNDDAGHILAQRLGGSGTDLRNIFPQSNNINRGVWAQVEDTVANVVQNYGSVIFNVNLEYSDEDSTRPNKIVYRIAREDNNHVVEINDLVNP